MARLIEIGISHSNVAMYAVILFSPTMDVTQTGTHHDTGLHSGMISLIMRSKGRSKRTSSFRRAVLAKDIWENNTGNAYSSDYGML